MNELTMKKKVYRIPPSKYWGQHWYPCSIGTLATFQLILTFAVVSMEIGNAAVDLFRANVYSGFWAFPFMISATIATFACVCMKRTQTKAIIALILQLISIIIMFIVIGFLIAIIASSFTLCLGLQCSQSASTFYSSSVYLTLKQIFISCELVFSIIYIILAIIYVILYIKCYTKLPRRYPVVRSMPVQSVMRHRQMSTVSQMSRSEPISSALTYNRSHTNKRLRTLTSSISRYNGAEQVCPICKHVSPYISQGNIVECPKCGYQSPFVEHAQQC